jgi:hypothetical protein
MEVKKATFQNCRKFSTYAQSASDYDDYVAKITLGEPEIATDLAKMDLAKRCYDVYKPAITSKPAIPSKQKSPSPSQSQEQQSVGAAAPAKGDKSLICAALIKKYGLSFNDRVKSGKQKAEWNIKLAEAERMRQKEQMKEKWQQEPFNSTNTLFKDCRRIFRDRRSRTTDNEKVNAIIPWMKEHHNANYVGKNQGFFNKNREKVSYADGYKEWTTNGREKKKVDNGSFNVYMKSHGWTPIAYYFGDITPNYITDGTIRVCSKDEAKALYDAKEAEAKAPTRKRKRKAGSPAQQVFQQRVQQAYQQSVQSAQQAYQQSVQSAQQAYQQSVQSAQQAYPQRVQSAHQAARESSQRIITYMEGLGWSYDDGKFIMQDEELPFVIGYDMYRHRLDNFLLAVGTYMIKIGYSMGKLYWYSNEEEKISLSEAAVKYKTEIVQIVSYMKGLGWVYNGKTFTRNAESMSFLEAYNRWSAI